MNKYTQNLLNHLDAIDYEALMSAIGKAALVSVTNANGDIIYVNETFVKVSKYSHDELLGQNHRILKSGQQPQSLFVDLWNTISQGKTWRNDIKNKAKDGSCYWVDTSIVPILDKDGKPERYLAVRFVITDKKEIEENLSRQNKAMLSLLDDLKTESDKFKEQVVETQKFAMAVRASNEHIVITDREGIILYANAAAVRTTGYSQEEMLGTKAGVLWGGHMDSSFYRDLWHTIKEDKKVFQGEINNIRKDGKPYIASVTISPVLSEDQRVLFFVGTERDITKEKYIDQAKSEFISIASHQLRTPVTGLRWVTEALTSTSENMTDKQRDYLKDVSLMSSRLVTLVEDLLNISRIELKSPLLSTIEDVNINEFAEKFVEEMKPYASSKTHTLIIDRCAEVSPIVEINKKTLYNVFQNLTSNAIDYSPINSTVSIGINLEGDHVKVSVVNHGPPISRDDQSRLFERFYRSESAKKIKPEGTGLGLYIVKTIVEGTGGRVGLDSSEDQVVFWFTMPLKRDKVKI